MVVIVLAVCLILTPGEKIGLFSLLKIPGTTPAPLTSQLPYLLTRSTTGEPFFNSYKNNKLPFLSCLSNLHAGPTGSTMHMGSVPYLLTKTTPSTMTPTGTTTFEGMMPYKLVRSSSSTSTTANARKLA